MHCRRLFFIPAFPWARDPGFAGSVRQQVFGGEASGRSGRLFRVLKNVFPPVAGRGCSDVRPDASALWARSRNRAPVTAPSPRRRERPRAPSPRRRNAMSDAVPPLQDSAMPPGGDGRHCTQGWLGCAFPSRGGLYVIALYGRNDHSLCQLVGAYSPNTTFTVHSFPSRCSFIVAESPALYSPITLLKSSLEEIS